jgi:hypothetical protein
MSAKLFVGVQVIPSQKCYFFNSFGLNQEEFAITLFESPPAVLWDFLMMFAIGHKPQLGS